MRLGLISDIHSNLAALDVVLSELRSVDALICAGDIVGYYADPNEVCERLRERRTHVIRGNHDAYTLGLITPDPQRVEAYRTTWTQNTLTKENLHWLGSLPVELRFHWNARTVRVRHASPWDEETYLYGDSLHLSEIVPADNEILIFGHTHHPMRVTAGGGGLIINPGSVGQPRDWRPQASFAVLDDRTGDVTFGRAEYDVASLQLRLRKLGWPGAMIDILSRSRQNSL